MLVLEDNEIESTDERDMREIHCITEGKDFEIRMMKHFEDYIHRKNLTAKLIWWKAGIPENVDKFVFLAYTYCNRFSCESLRYLDKEILKGDKEILIVFITWGNSEYEFQPDHLIKECKNIWKSVKRGITLVFDDRGIYSCAQNDRGIEEIRKFFFHSESDHRPSLSSLATSCLSSIPNKTETSLGDRTIPKQKIIRGLYADSSEEEKEDLLLEFWNWLTTRYKTLKVKRLYIGENRKGPYRLYRKVIGLVIDEFRVIKETMFHYNQHLFPIFCKLFRFPSLEGANITSMETDIEHDKSLHLKFTKCIQNNSPFLFEKHSNLEIISASGFRSMENGKEKVREPCIVFYCACKGVVPNGESEFPRNIDGLNTDVREGFFYQFPNDGFFKRSTDVLDPLMMGGSISSKDFSKGGTLGGFVTFNNGDIGFITCAHVLFDLSTQCNERSHFDVVQPAYSYNNTNNVCGVHELSCFPSTPFQHCTLDASLVKLTTRIPERGLFSDLSVEDLHENGFSIENLPEYSEGTIRDYRQEHFTHLRDPCFKWGAKTGFTKGALRLNGVSVRWVNDVIDLGKPSSQNSYMYHYQLECLGTGTSFALPGDSGALVFQLDPMATKEDQHRFHCIGMIVGGTSDFKTIVTPIGPILEAFNVKMHAFPQEKMDES